MRRKIWRMSEGQFNETAPRIILEPAILNETIQEGETFSGSFCVLCDKNAPAKGLVYCDNPYIYIATPAFNEENSTINFNITATHLRNGDHVEGKFYVYSDGYVKTLDFSINVVKRLAQTSLGQIATLEDFCELAKRSWREAIEVFYSGSFAKLIKEQPKSVRLLYRGFSKAARIDANLEEFLVSCGLKDRMMFEVDTTKREYSFLSQNRKESIDITRNTWGYIRIEVSCDGDFVSVENNVLTSDFFLGSRLSLNFYIHKDKLHAGKNSCCITLKGMGLVRKIHITASLSNVNERHNDEIMAVKREFINMYKCYEQFRLKNISGQEWALSTINSCDLILNTTITRDRLFLRLIKTQALIVRGERKLALEIIKNLRVDIQDKKSAEWAYLLYLGALLEPQEEYVLRLLKEIESIQEVHPEDIRIFWFLLFLKKEYVRNKPEKLRAIRHWMAEGYASPIFYAECFDMFMEDIYLIDSLDNFNVKILRWALKHGALNKHMADRIFDLLYKETPSENIYDLLLKCYKLAPDDQHLKALISYLLRRGEKDSKYIDIYAKGIKRNIRLTGLFEAYLGSLPLDYDKPLSNMVLRYFSYNTSVPAERKALVYANIILYKEEEGTYYQQNARRIHEFCIEQMKAGNIDDNLTVCYQDCIDNAYIDSRMADGLQNILHLKKVICMDGKATRVLVVEEELKEPIVSEFMGPIAYIPMYTKDARVFIELNDGRITTDEKIFYVEEILNGDNAYAKVRDLSTIKRKLLLHDIAKMESAEQLSDVYVDECQKYLFSEEVDPDYLRKQFHLFTAYYKNLAREDVLLTSLLYADRYKDYDNATLAYLASLLMIDKQDEKALEIFKNYLIPEADRRLLLGLVKRLCENPAKSQGEFVLEICIQLLREGYHCEETIEYLLRHFIGVNGDMRLIFKYANPYSEALPVFCERFLVQGLYTESLLPGDDEILISYLDKNPNPMIVEAYISYFCHRYLKYDEPVPDSVFAILFRQVKITDSINDACRFAYSKYLCTKENLSDQEMEILDMLINDQLIRNIYFPFYKDMDEDLIKKYHLYDRMYACYETRASKNLALLIKGDEENFTEIDMVEVYPGIYVRDMMIFFGENLRYSIIDRDEPEVSLAYGDFTYQDIGALSESRFFLINRMEEELFYKEEDKLKADLISYHDMQSAQRSIFNIL